MSQWILMNPLGRRHFIWILSCQVAALKSQILVFEYQVDWVFLATVALNY